MASVFERNKIVYYLIEKKSCIYKLTLYKYMNIYEVLYLGYLGH